MKNTSETISGCLNPTAAGSFPPCKGRQGMEWLSDLMYDQKAGTKDSLEGAKTQLSEQLAASTEVKFANPRYPQRTYPMHRSVWEWCNQNITNSTGETHQARTHATREIILLFDKFRRHGVFSFNSTRVRKVVGDGAARLLKKFVDACPYVRQTHGYIPGKRCRGFTFELPGITFPYATDINEESHRSFDRATVNGIRVGMIDRRMLVTVNVPGHWLLSRSAKWHTVAVLKGWIVGVDSFGTNFGGGVHRAFANLSVDKALNVRCQADVPCGVRECAKCEHAKAYHSKLVNRSFSPCVTLIRSRLYYVFSSCPKLLRGHLLLDGERLGEVDISASYLCALISQLWEDTATKKAKGPAHPFAADRRVL